MFIFTCICSLFINRKKTYEETSRFYRFLLETCTALAVFFGRIHIHATGLEMIPENAKYLMVQNHLSNFDPILSWHVLKKSKLVFITKPENFRQPVFGPIVYRLCFLGIDRDNPRNALKTVIKAADYIKNDKYSVGLYPEGTRNRTNEPLIPFHHGSLKIAQMAKCPIAVTTITGTEKIAKNFPWRRSDIYFDVLRIIPSEESSSMNTVELSDSIRDTMLENITKER